MRHANTDWNDYDGNDYGRVISTEGKKDTTIVLKDLIKKKVYFDIVHTSPSTRTMQTLEIFKQKLKLKKTQIYEDYNLYEGSLENYLLKLSKVAKKHRNILVITHEPNILWLIDYFNNQKHKNYQKFLEKNFITSSILKLCFDVSSWEDISGVNCSFDFFLNPNDLT